MKRLSLILAIVLILNLLAGCSGSADLTGTPKDKLSISEVMADNKNLCMGHNLDWVEIYNAGDKDVALDSYCLTDDMATPAEFSLKGYTVPAKGYVVIVLDVDDPLHLSAQGETIYLTYGNKAVSQITFGASAGGESFDANGVCKYTTPGFENTEAGYNQYLGTLSLPGLFINEVMASNSKFNPVNDQYYDMVEIKNNTDAAIDLSGYTLSDKRKEPARYSFPAVTLQPGEFYVVYCSGNTSLGDNHASFKISTTNQETVYLSKDEVIIDMISIPADLVENESYGRDGARFLYYSVPTFGKENGQGFVSGITAPTASVASGSYLQAQQVKLSGSGKIYYTTDGSRPTTASNVYSSPITVSGVTTIRTFCVDGNRKSNVSAYTYVIGKDHDLPVVSVSIPQEMLTGESIGILNHINVNNEHECQVTLIENGEEKFSVPCGFRLHGNGSREMPKQNFQLRFRSEYGVSKLNYKLFDNRDFDEFDSLLLKGGSEDFNRAILRDELATTTLEGATALYLQAYKPVVLYLAGQYWGIYYIRERYSDDYVASHFNVSENSVDLLETGGSAQAGSSADYRALKNYVTTHDMSLPENYKYLCEKVDINSLMDWYICRSYMGDKDLANIRCFRTRDGDGKWRWMYFDLDWAFTVANDRPFSGIIADYNGEPTLMRAAIKSAEGRDAFLKRYAYLMSTVLNEEHLNSTVDSIVADIDSEIDRDRDRWGYTRSGWENAVARVRSYYSEGKRDIRVKDDLKTYFGLTDEQMAAYFGN